MSSFIKIFDRLNKNDTHLAGGKGASLGEMTQAGIPVPPGFVILSNAFEQFIDSTGLSTEINAALNSVNQTEIHTVEHASEKIKGLILQKDIPGELAKDVLSHFKKLNSAFVAVRSSATAEDSASAAWAGQLDSFLNTTEENLLDNVKKCWASLFTPRAIFYRFEKKLHNTKISVAVVVQKMIESEVSGIVFSVHPVTEDYNQLIIEASYGLGEAIVSGQVTPDSYVVEKNEKNIIEKTVQEKTRGLFRSAKGGNEWINIATAQIEKQALTDKQILELSKLITKIENHYGFPVDIEWSLFDDKFYIVQSRPITTLSKTDRNDNIQKIEENNQNYHKKTSESAQIGTIINQPWTLFLSRPFSLFGTSLWNYWYTKGILVKLFPFLQSRSLYIQDDKEVVRNYWSPSDITDFKQKIANTVNDPTFNVIKKLKYGLDLNAKCNILFKRGELSMNFEDAIEYLNELIVFEGMLPYYFLDFISATNKDKEAISELINELRGKSSYQRVIQEIVMPAL